MPVPPDEALTLGDRYLLGEVIGRGGMADVYRATDQLLSRPVAIKVLRETADDESDRRRFTAEATTLARLNHVNLVMVLDAGITAEQPYLVMELVEGPTLGQRTQTGPLELDEVGRIGAQMADALTYAHGAGVVHRDVKPGNVLLGSDGRTRLADFGIARLIGDTVRHTQTGHAIGTPAYLSPEQVRGDDVTPAVDVYSLGLVLLEALTGERAFPGSPTESAIVRLSKSPTIPESLPGPWRDVLSQMTAMEPAERPTPQEVATRLRTPVPAPTATDPTRTMVMAPAPAAAPAAPATAAAPVGPSVIDRAGDALARQPGRIAARVAAMPPHQRGVAAAVAGILFLVIIAGIAADSGGSTDDELPGQTPQELEQPLQDLHDAVNGTG